MTGAAVEADTDAKVTLTVFGDKGSFGPHPLELPEGTFNIGQTDSFNVSQLPWGGDIDVNHSIVS